jgi:thiol-disulfide isomerase/thioredoxin
MKHLKALILAIAALFAALPLAAAAQAAATPYSASAFEAAQREGRTIVVDVHADWCPTCRAQAPILSELRNDPRLADALFVRVDFDSDRDFLRAHRIPRQSTILVFDGAEEKGRSIAETDRARLRAFVLGNI